MRILELNGFVAIRQRGSHRIMQKELETTTITVPVPLHNSLRRGTLASIVRQSELARSLFDRRFHPASPRPPRQSPHQDHRRTLKNQSRRMTGSDWPVKSRYRKMTADVRTTRHILLCRAVFHVRVAPKEKFSIAPAPKAVQPAFRLVPSLSSSRQPDIVPAIHPSRPPEEQFPASETSALFL